jgi:putative oxidoreductase
MGQDGWRRRLTAGRYAPVSTLAIPALSRTYTHENEVDVSARGSGFFHSQRSREVAHLLLRVMTALLFMQHGFQHLFGMFGGYRGVPGAAAAPFSRGWIAGVMEIVIAPLIVVGLFTRPLAFLLSGMMAVAYFWVHAKNGFFPITNGGEDPALYCFIFLYLAFAGGGRWSVDEWRERQKTARSEERAASR